jgi:hypothetical protein
VEELGMSRSPVARILAVTTLLLAGSVLSASAEGISGKWGVFFPSFHDDVTLELRAEQDGHGVRTSITVDVNRLEGLQLSELSHARRLSFTWAHEAGTLRFEGSGRWLRASGLFTFEPDAGYRERMTSLGYPGLGGFDLLRMVIHDLDTRYLARLAEIGYGAPPLDEVMRLVHRGIDIDYVDGLQGLGYKPDLRLVVRMYSHGISVRRVHEFEQRGLTGIPVDDFLRLFRHGIDAGYVRGLVDAGFRLDQIDSIVRLHNHGIDPDRVSRFRAVDGFDLSTDDLVRLHSHGVSPETIDQLHRLGYDDLSVDEAIRLQHNGVDPGFVRRLVDAGYEDLSVDELIRIHQRGEIDRLVRRKQTGEAS